MGLQDEVPEQKKLPDKQAPGVCESGAQPASAAAGVSGCESSGSGAKPASAAQPAPAPKPSADGAGPSGSQPATSADPSTPPKKKADPSSPATPAKGKGPK